MRKKRNIILMYIFGIITLGFYFLYWTISTKNEMNNEYHAEIPTAWLIIIPIANLFFHYKYYDAFSKKVKKDDNGLLWFILSFIGPVNLILPAIVQMELNKRA